MVPLISLMVHSELLLFYPISAVLYPHGPCLSQAICLCALSPISPPDPSLPPFGFLFLSPSQPRPRNSPIHFLATS